MPKSEIFYYLLAILFGLSAGLLEITVGDLLVTALSVLVSTMVLGYLSPKHAWRWLVIVGGFVPLARIAAYVLLSQRASRAQIWESGLGFLTGIAGAYCGVVARMAIRELFPPNREARS
jgi:hypothetical protein